MVIFMRMTACPCHLCLLAISSMGSFGLDKKHIISPSETWYLNLPASRLL
jgi:hypothetical protein